MAKKRLKAASPNRQVPSTRKRFVAYRVGSKSGKALESKAFKTEHMARNFVSYWNTVPRCKAMLAVHIVSLDTFGVAIDMGSLAIEQ